jgi:hypothetical protein
LSAPALQAARRIGEGVEDMIASGNLHRVPAVFRPPSSPAAGGDRPGGPPATGRPLDDDGLLI